MSKVVTVISATRKTAESIARLQNEILPEAPWSCDELVRFVDDARSLALIAVDQGANLKGFVLGRCVNDEAEILSIVVDHEARRLGIGFQLISTAFQNLRARGGRYVFLEVATGNVAALALYEKLGAHSIGYRSRYYQRGHKRYEDAIMLRGTLDHLNDSRVGTHEKCFERW